MVVKLFVVLLCTATLSALAEPPAQHKQMSIFEFQGQLKAQFQFTDGYDGWGQEDVGKFVDTKASQAWQGEFDITYRLSDTVSVEATISSSNTDFSAPLGLTEAFIKWRPIPASRLRHMLKIGSLYPPISLENTDIGWHSPFSNSFSAINTWIGEEVRVMGVEFEHAVRMNVLGSQNAFKFRHAIFFGNDPAGSLLAWKGWSLHQRQSRIGEELPRIPLPVFATGAPFEAQANHIDPFVEVDDRPGHYAVLDWAHGDQFLVRATYYDNQADPETIRQGQYGWRTRFYAAGLTTQWRHFNIVAQVVSGNTRMGPRIARRSAVDNLFRSEFLLLSRSVENHRITIRRDWFEIDDRDSTAWDPNQELGNAWTVSYQYRLNERWTFDSEWVSIKTRRQAWLELEQDPRQQEQQFRLGFAFRF